MMNKIKSYFTVDSLESMEMDRQNRIFKNKCVLWLVVAACAAFDAYVFYTRFDSILTNSVRVNFLMALACAAAIDFFPVVVTNRLMVVRKTLSDKVMIGVFGFVFICVVVLSVVLGYLGAQDLAGSSSGMMVMNGMTAAQTQTDATLEQKIISTLMGFMPVLTTMVIIGLSFVDAKTNRINTLKIQEIRLKRELGEMKAELAYLEEGLDTVDLETLDSKHFAIMTGLLDDIRLYSLIASRRVLAMKLGDSSAAILLQQENTVRESIESKINDDLSENFPDSDKLSTASARGQTMLT